MKNIFRIIFLALLLCPAASAQDVTQRVGIYAFPQATVQGTTSAITDTTSTLLLAAPGAGLRNYITYITCVNSSATGTLITVQDGSGGTALMTLAAAASQGGHSASLPVPLRQPTTNTGLYVAPVTTSTSTICSAVGFKGQ